MTGVQTCALPIFRHAMNQLLTCAEQMVAVDTFFGELASQGQRLTYVEELAA